MSKKTLIPLIIAIPFILLIGFGFYNVSKFYATYDGPEVKFAIKPGEGFSSVNYRLKKENIINDARLFHYYSKYTNQLTALKAGTYKISTGLNMKEVLETFTKGVPELTRITIPEGKNLYEIGKILEENEIAKADEFIKACKDPELIKSLNIEAPSLEGYLFPDTYLFSPGTTVNQIIATLLKQFKEKTKNLDLNSTNLNPHEVIILASIVEKETGAKWERPTIAGVYLNRLKKKMRLQADPTTIYGIWETYNGNLRRKHLLEKTDYNTYKMSGLPLGPIANPSLEAIQAVLAPKQHEYIFFVSKNDGTHVFTPTYKEHQKAVEYWQKDSSKRAGKSWRDLKQNNN